jgi:hypothetical protein
LSSEAYQAQELSSLFTSKDERWFAMIDKNNSCSTIGFEKRMDEYDIVFGTANDKDYEFELNLFKTRERYNYHKCEALRFLDLRERYTDTRITEMARLMLDDSKAKATLGGIRIITQIKHDVFGREFGKNFHRVFGKLKDDILK